MRTFLQLFSFKIFLLIFVLSRNINAQNISLSYERDLTDIRFLYTLNHTESGFALYYGDESSGSRDYVKLRNNNTVIWQTETDLSPEYHAPNNFFETESGYYYTGDGGLSTTGAFGRINKVSGNIEVKRTYSNNQFTRGYAINSTFGNNLILGGYFWQNSLIATIKVVNPLGDILQSKSTNELGGIWGSNIHQIEKTQDNGYLLIGSIIENQNCGEIGNRSLWLCKLNSNLNVIWSKKYGNGNGSIDRAWASDFTGPKAIITENNDIILLGQTFCTNGNGGGPNNSGEGTWLMKLNSLGNILKYKLVSTNLQDYSVDYSGIENSCNNSFVLSGISGSLLGVNYFIERFDYELESNDVIFRSESQTEKTFSYADLHRSIDNTYIISGRRNYYDNNGTYNTEYFIAKTTPDPACGTNPPLLLCETTTGQYSICEDFEKLQAGNLIPQGSPKFSLFSNSASEQATVTTEKAFAGTKSIKFSNTSDIDFNIDRTIESPSRMEWMSSFDTGKSGSWGLETNNASQYAIVCRYQNGSGNINIYNTSNQLINIASFTYPNGQWFKNVLVFNNLTNSIEVWINNKFIYKLPNYQSYKITDLNIYGTSGLTTNEFYIDNLLYYETKLPCIVTFVIDPVCVNGEEFTNSSYASCSGYSSDEWVQGSCNGSLPITLDIDDNICGAQNSEIEVPVRVKNYNKIAGLQLKISSSNNNNAEIVGFSNINPNSGMGNVDFAVVDKKLVLTYADTEKSLSDNSVLFTIKVKLKGSVGSTANLIFEGDQKALDTNGGIISVTAIQGSVCISQSSFTASGKITNTKDKGIKDVNVTWATNQSVKTNATGDYNLSNLMTGTNYIIKPSLDEKLDNNVDISDLLLLRRHMQGLSLFASPYTYLAADLSFDKIIDISDLLLLRRIMQGLTTQLANNQLGWRFVPKTYSFPSSGNPLTGTIPETIQLNSISANQNNQHFIGVKYGDLDHSAVPLNEPIIEKRSAADVELNIQSLTASSGSNINVEIKCKNFIKGAVMQFSIQWPTDKLQLLNVPSGSDLVIPGTTIFDQTRLAEGKLGFIWETNDFVNGTTLGDNSVVYWLKFKILGPNNTIALIENSIIPKNGKFVDADITEIPLKIYSGTITIAKPSSTDDEDLNAGIKIFPNPSSGVITIEYRGKLPETISVQSNTGQEFKFPISDNKLDLSSLTSGVYAIKGVINNKTFYKKIVLIR